MQDCRLCMCHTNGGRCSKDAHTAKDGKIVGWARCSIHDKKAKVCPYYWESEYLRDYYEEHPLLDLP